MPVKVLRHAQDHDVPRRLIDLGIEQFERYQSAQRVRKFGDAKILVSFLHTDGRRAEFIGVYRVHECKQGHAPARMPEVLPPELLDRCNSTYHYVTTRATEFDRFRGRIQIEWDALCIRWVRQNMDANVSIVGVKTPSGNWSVPGSREALIDLEISLPCDLDSANEGAGEYSEGGRLLRSHFVIERNRQLVRDSKSLFKKIHGRLHCEACSFDFLSVYGEEFIECHHTIPVHKLPSDGSTRIEDVVLLCSNCHRMVHRRKDWLSVVQLKKLLMRRKL